MRVVIAGGHGKIALQLARLLTAHGDQAVGLIRRAEQVPDLAEAGATAVVCDLEQADTHELAGYLAGADAVVFAAGAGPGSGIARKDTVDRAAAVLLADAAVRAGVRRYLQISSMGADRAGQPGFDPVFAAYLVAKKAAEDALWTRDLDATVVRPGQLLDMPGTGRVRLGPPPIPDGAVPRADVAAVLLALLVDGSNSVGRTLELVSGPDPIADALRVALAD